MGARGPKPKTNDADPFRPGAPVMPKGLRPAARECWKRLIAEMEAAGRVRLVDRDVLLLACCNWADFVEHSKALREQGPVITGSQGTPITNPLVRIVKAAETMYLRCREQLCLSQPKRDRIPVKAGSAAEAEDPLAKFNARRRESKPPGLKVSHG